VYAQNKILPHLSSQKYNGTKGWGLCRVADLVGSVEDSATKSAFERLV